MISKEYYLENKLMVCPKFGGKYKDVVISSTICREQPIHIHDCMEIVYVFRGAVECKISFEKYILREGEFVVLNSFELHQLKSIAGDAAISCIHISQKFFHYSEGFLIWWADILKHNAENYHRQVNNIKTLIMQYENSEEEEVVNGSIERIIQMFRTEFRVENFRMNGDHSIVSGSENDMKRAGEIYLYLYKFCNEKLSLDKMAADFMMSRYYLSHFIKKITGIGMQKSLSIIRCDRAEIELLGCDKSIEEVREAFAFSSTQYFNNAFRDLYGMTPAAYRKQFRKETVLYKGFDEDPISDIGLLMNEKTHESSSDKKIELILKNGTEHILVVENNGGSEILKTYEAGGNKKVQIRLDSEDCVIILKSNKCDKKSN